MKALLEGQTRALEKRLSCIEATQESTSGRAKRSFGGDQSAYLDDASAGERAGSAFSRRDEVVVDSLLPAIGKVGIAGGSNLVMGFREISRIKTAVSKLSSSVDFPLWEIRFEGFLNLVIVCRLETDIDMLVGDPPITSRFLLNQTLSETSNKTST